MSEFFCFNVFPAGEKKPRNSKKNPQTHPSSNALSMIDTSIVLIVTGGSLIPSTHEPSQGAGQTRPVNSGKLLVSKRRSRASRHCPAATSALNSGTLLPSGQPVAVWWQKGVPQPMQRADWVASWSASSAPGRRAWQRGVKGSKGKGRRDHF